MSGIYATYYDCEIGWEAAVEITLATGKGSGGSYQMHVYDRKGKLLAQHSEWVSMHGADRVDLNKLIADSGVQALEQGLVVVSDAANSDDEFVSVLKMGTGETPEEIHTSLRFIPFTRVP